jgi:hypothetical protein
VYGTASKSHASVLERVYSIFVTLVCLDPTIENKGNLDHLMESLRSRKLHKVLFHLVELTYK